MPAVDDLPRDADVVIVGGGIVGCAAAYYLAKRGLSVLLLEKDEIGRAQSGRNWGFIRQQGRDPAELPLMIESNRIWRGIERELNADVEWNDGGNVALAPTAERVALFEAWSATARQHGLDTRVLSGQEVKAMIPAMRVDWVGALYTASDGHAEPRKATQAFANAARALGARIVERCTVTSIGTTAGAVADVRYDRQTSSPVRDDDRGRARDDNGPPARDADAPSHDRSESGVVRTRCVVAAAGAWTAKLVQPLALSLPVRWVRSTVARTTALPHITDAGVWAPTVAFRQRRDGTVNLGGGGWADHDVTLESLRHFRLFMPNYLKNRALFQFHVGKPFVADTLARIPGSSAKRHPFAAQWALEPAPNAKKAQWTASEFCRLFPSIGDFAITDTWAGYIDATPDALPVIGGVDAPRGLVLATGFSGHGFGLGPAAGRAVAEVVAGATPPLDLRAFRFSRFAEGDIGEPRAVL